MNKINFSNLKLNISKHSPEILIISGIAGVITSTILACKATTKLNETVEKAKMKVNDVHDRIDEEDYTPKMQRKDLAVAYGKAGYELVKLYGPALTVGIVSITAILSSNNILRKRNVAIASAYAATERLFKEYRGRVIDRFGKEVDNELRYNIKKKEVQEVTVNEDGTVTTETKTVSVAEGPFHDEFSRFFDESNPNWVKDAEKNKFFIMQVERFANQKLQENKFVTLNEVYEALGFDKIAAGQVVGWTLDKGNPDSLGYISFGIFDDIYVSDPKAKFINGHERSILLDFNHEGNILDYI